MTSRGAPPSSGSSDRRQELERAIANEEAGLRRLEAEQAEAHVRLSVLRSELAALDLVPAPAPAQTLSAQVAPLTAGPRTPADKVKLFRQLFRGRPDIYSKASFAVQRLASRGGRRSHEVSADVPAPASIVHMPGILARRPDGR